MTSFTFLPAKSSPVPFLFRVAACIAVLSGFALAESLTGTVTNKTTNKPSAGDDVVLIRLAQGMQELSRTKTDAKGHFTLEVPDPAIHLVRVTHDKANYFRPAPAGTESVEVDVYNAAEKVKGVTGEADVMRIQSDESGKGLRVVENFFVKNESTPPMTQMSDRPFEFYLPPGAVVEGSAALSPGGMPVQAAPVPLGDPNHYAFVFPVRPGETRFQISYKLPYSGSFTFSPKPAMATDTIAVMMPKSMTFKAGASSPYSAVTEELTAQTYVARNVSPSQPLEFTVSGSGQLPRDSQTGAAGGAGPQPGGGAAADSANAAAADTRPGGGLGTPIDPEGNNDPWAKYKWWILGGLGLVLAAAAGFLLKGGGAPVVPAVAAASSPVVAVGGNTLLSALKDELFALETDRLQGKLTETEFLEQKAALEVVLRRALARTPESVETI
ncbi:carboxypeptidase regulatory-like domain-containing protein [Granulicella sp. dw_53]|uniref:carboxypeptidase regulatory-like domain-containing protein n=1 Tax=Granulicella sp. dw_53 TaxID=2719792 RepID=UPI0031F5F171